MNLPQGLRASLFAALLSVATPSWAALPESVNTALREAGIAPGSVSLWIAPAAGGAPSWQHQSSAAFNPASVMKLLTTYAALDMLGPSYTWRTEVWLDGPLRNGVLQGNLILRGGGDPALSWDRFGQLLRELRGRGLRDIQDDVIIDRSLFAAELESKDFDDQPLRAYNATPDALLLNFKAISLQLRPGKAGEAVQVQALTPFAPLHIDNSLLTTGGACTHWRSDLTENLGSGDAGGLYISLSGTLAEACGERTLNMVVQDGPRLAAGIFRQLWAELGGSWHGRAQEATLAQFPAASLFTSWLSPPLADVIRDINQFSNNVMARQLLLSLAAQDPGIAASKANAAALVGRWLGAQQLDMPELVLDNGAGLSREARISAAHLGSLLQRAWASPLMPAYVASLPLAGSSGTAKRRFASHPASGQAWLKTGSLNEVMSHAGYVRDAQGQWQVFVMLVNDPRAAAAENAVQAALNTAFLGSTQSSGKQAVGTFNTDVIKQPRQNTIYLIKSNK